MSGSVAGVRSSGASRPRSRPVEKTLLILLTLVAAVAIVGAVVVNVLWGPTAYVERTVAEPDPDAMGSGGSVTMPETSAVDQIPENVVGFETIARQAVPGQGDRVGEAVYKTLTMNIEAIIPTGNYVRVESSASAGDARVRLAELMAPYSVRQEDVRLNGVTEARTGYSADEGAYAVGWVYDVYAVLVKTMFTDWVPVEKRDFLRMQAMPLSETVDLFQRTGQQGVAAAGSDPSEVETGTVLPPVEGETTE